MYTKQQPEESDDDHQKREGGAHRGERERGARGGGGSSCRGSSAASPRRRRGARAKKTGGSRVGDQIACSRSEISSLLEAEHALEDLADLVAAVDVGERVLAQAVAQAQRDDAAPRGGCAVGEGVGRSRGSREVLVQARLDGGGAVPHAQGAPSPPSLSKAKAQHPPHHHQPLSTAPHR